VYESPGPVAARAGVTAAGNAAAASISTRQRRLRAILAPEDGRSAGDRR